MGAVPQIRAWCLALIAHTIGLHSSAWKPRNSRRRSTEEVIDTLYEGMLDEKPDTPREILSIPLT